VKQEDASSDLCDALQVPSHGSLLRSHGEIAAQAEQQRLLQFVVNALLPETVNTHVQPRPAVLEVGMPLAEMSVARAGDQWLPLEAPLLWRHLLVTSAWGTYQ